MSTVTDPTRDRGILNDRERRYLLGDTDIEPRSQTERDIRATIRIRMRHAIYDFALLFDHLEDRDIEQVFDPRTDDVGELRTAIEDTLGFFYRATINFHPPFQYLAKEGIQRAERTHFDRFVKATIDVEAAAPIDPAEIQERMADQRTAGLTPEEAQWIAETVIGSGEFSFDTLDAAHEHLRERQAGLEPTEGDQPEQTRD